MLTVVPDVRRPPPCDGAHGPDATVHAPAPPAHAAPAVTAAARAPPWPTPPAAAAPVVAAAPDQPVGVVRVPVRDAHATLRRALARQPPEPPEPPDGAPPPPPHAPPSQQRGGHRLLTPGGALRGLSVRAPVIVN